MLFVFLYFFRLAAQFYITHIFDGSDNIDKEQNQHAGTDKESGYGGYKINGKAFNGNTDNSCQQTNEQKPVGLAFISPHINKQVNKNNQKGQHQR